MEGRQQLLCFLCVKILFWFYSVSCKNKDVKLCSCLGGVRQAETVQDFKEGGSKKYIWVHASPKSTTHALISFTSPLTCQGRPNPCPVFSASLVLVAETSFVRS